MKLSDFFKGAEDLSAPPVKQAKTSLVPLAFLTPLVVSLAYVGLTWLCNRILPPSVASDTLESIKPILVATGIGGGGGGTLGLALRCLQLTGGKIKNQTTPDVPQTVAIGEVNAAPTDGAGDALSSIGSNLGVEFP